MLGGLAVGAGSAYAQSPPMIQIQFNDATMALNGSETLTFTITNPNPAVDLTGVSFNDSLPSGLIIADPDSLEGSCNDGDIDVETDAISLTDGTVLANDGCSFSINVYSTATGTQVDTTDPVTSNEGGTGGTGTASIDVLSPPSIAAAFGSSLIQPGQSTSLTFTVTNPDSEDLTNLDFQGSLPTGMVIATPNQLSNTCGGLATADVGTSSISLDSGTVSGSMSCSLSVEVTASTPGTALASTGPVTSDTGGTGNSTSASTVVALPPSAAISAPVVGAAFKLGQAASTTFACTEGAGGTGIATCVDQNGHPSGAALDTATTGPHTLTITATSQDGLTATKSASYQVAAGPSVTVTGPASGAILKLGQAVASSFSCSEGAGGPGLASCLDQSGHRSGTAVNTSTVGKHSLTVTATSQDGFKTSRTITYTVQASNQFVVANIKAQRNGTVTFNVTVPNAGTVGVLETVKPAAHRFTFASAHKSAAGHAVLHFIVKPNAKGRKLLAHSRHRIGFRLSVMFTPTGGVARSVSKTGLHIP
jgi:uncharacterized repeat protein (TIGR01451 family)